MFREFENETISSHGPACATDKNLLILDASKDQPEQAKLLNEMIRHFSGNIFMKQKKRLKWLIKFSGNVFR